MNRFVVVGLLFLVGCEKPIPRVPAEEYTPTLAVAVGITASKTSPKPGPPTPNGEVCGSCDGLGWYGNMANKFDCPDCDTVWESGNDEKRNLSAEDGGDQSTKPDKELPAKSIGAENTVAIDSLAVHDCCDGQFEAIKEFVIEEMKKAAQKPQKKKLRLTIIYGPSCNSCIKADLDMRKPGHLKDVVTEHYVTDRRLAKGDERRPAFIVNDDYGGREIGYFGPMKLTAWLKAQAEKRGGK